MINAINTYVFIHFMNNIDISSLDGRALKTLLAVLDTGSVSAAANQLGLSQSAVSHALDRMRRAFGDDLFVRSGRGIAPTPYAATLPPRLRKLLDDLQALARLDQFTPAGSRLALTVAANDYQRDLLLPAWRQRLVAAGVDLTLTVIASGIPDAALLRNDHCDLLVSPRPPQADDIFQQRLLEDTQCCFYDAGQRRPPENLDDYLAADHLTVTLQAPYVPAVDNHLAALGRQRRLALQVANFSGVAAFLRNTALIATLPSRLASGPLAGFAISPLPFSLPPLTLVMAWHRRNHTDPAHRWIRQQLRETAANTA